MATRAGSVTSKKKLEELEALGWIRYSVAKMKSFLKPKMIREQEGKCAICEIALSTLAPARVVMDHDHKRKFIRGVLCDLCNRQIGVADKQGRKGDWFRKAACFFDRSELLYSDDSKQKYIYPEAKPKAERRTAVKKPTKTSTRH